MSQTGVLAIISGFSGAGKGTVVRQMMQNGDYELSISATTRARRPDEVDGKDYFFMTKEEFEQTARKKGFLEWAKFSGNYYGTPKDFVLQKIESGRNIILEIDVQGALQVKHQYPDAVLIFLAAPSMEVLEERLRGRGTESEEQIAVRMQQVSREVAEMPQYDYVVINDEVERASAQVMQIISDAQKRVSAKTKWIEQFRGELRQREQ